VDGRPPLCFSISHVRDNRFHLAHTVAYSPRRAPARRPMLCNRHFAHAAAATPFRIAFGFRHTAARIRPALHLLPFLAPGIFFFGSRVSTAAPKKTDFSLAFHIHLPTHSRRTPNLLPLPSWLRDGRCRWCAPFGCTTYPLPARCLRTSDLPATTLGALCQHLPLSLGLPRRGRGAAHRVNFLSNTRHLLPFFAARCMTLRLPDPPLPLLTGWFTPSTYLY